VDASIETIRAARRELDDVIGEIRMTPGNEDFLAAPTFDDISAVATAEHPLVYLAAADLGGVGLVVRGPDVEHVPLGGLSADVLRTRVSHYLSTYDAYRREPEAGRERWRRELDQVTGWLWPNVMGPVLDALGQITRAVFVPGGLLGLLPLHAAWTADSNRPGGRRYALDSMVITYTPNARALKAARILAQQPVDRLLAVADPPHVPALVPLPLARVEAELAAHYLTHSVALRPQDATKDRVLAEIATANVVHLACHGFAELQAPLQSGLNLTGDDVLRLSDLLALKSELRLAVLSACETSMPGTELPDEVVSLPTGLLQAGVGGVVASQWAVPRASEAALEALSMTAPGAPHWAENATNYGAALIDLYRLDDDPAHIDQGVAALEEGIGRLPNTAPDLPAGLTTLAALLGERAETRAAQPDDGARALALSIRALEATPNGSTRRGLRLSNLATMLMTQYSTTGQRSLLDSAIETYEQAVEESRASGPELPRVLGNLGAAYCERSLAAGDRDDLTRGVDQMRRCCTLGVDVDVESALRVSLTWGEWAIARQSWPEATEALEYGMSAAENAFRAQLVRADKESWIAVARNLPALAAYAAAAYGNNSVAASAIERGRAMLLSEALELGRADLTALTASGRGELVQRYRSAAERWLGWSDEPVPETRTHVG
jgi:hypothetical protein